MQTLTLTGFLTPEELFNLTEYRRWTRQIEWLKKNAVEHTLALSGRPLVRLSAIGAAEPEPPPAVAEPFVIPPLDRKAAFRALAEISATRQLYRRGLDLPASGVYFLFQRGELNYIGRSVTVNWRLLTHYMNRVDRKTRVIPFDEVAVIDVPRYWLDEVERHHIKKCQPPFNIRGIRR